MDTGARFTDCPQYMDRHGTQRCGLPAVLEDHYLTRSTDGPLQSARIRCPRGHWFNGSMDSLTWQKDPVTVAAPPALAEAAAVADR